MWPSQKNTGSLTARFFEEAANKPAVCGVVCSELQHQDFKTRFKAEERLILLQNLQHCHTICPDQFKQLMVVFGASWEKNRNPAEKTYMEIVLRNIRE